MTRREVELEPRPCPECEQGKHAGCDDTTWDNDADGLTACPCSAAGHGAQPWGSTSHIPPEPPHVCRRGVACPPGCEAEPT